LVIFALIAVGVYVWSRSADDAARTNTENESEATEQMVERSSYQNTTYNFSFEVPVGYAFTEYQPERVSVGQQRGMGFDSSADASVVSSADTDDTFEDYNAFLEDRLLTMCAADGPAETISCTGIARSQPFTAANGMSGTEFYLTEETTVLGAEVDTTTAVEKGPFFAFDLSGQTEEEDMMALIIHPPIATPEGNINTTLVRAVAESVQVHSPDGR